MPTHTETEFIASADAKRCSGCVARAFSMISTSFRGNRGVTRESGVRCPSETFERTSIEGELARKRQTQGLQKEKDKGKP